MEITEVKKEKKLTKLGWFVLGLSGGSAVILSAICFPFVSPALRKICLPYVPATTQQVANVLEALRGAKGSLLDIGSGDGRIVLEAAQRGFKADGVELNFWLVLYSKLRALKLGLSNSVSFYRRDLWKFPIGRYENVVIFGVQEMMEDLQLKFQRELCDANVVACRFPIPNRTPLKVIGTGIDTVWLYRFNSKDGSS